MLTAQQKKLLSIIKSSMDSDGIVPSYEDMTSLMGLRSKSGIHRYVLALEERGYINRIPNRARAIEILKDENGEQVRTESMLAYSNAKLRSEVAELNLEVRRLEKELMCYESKLIRI